MNRRNLIVLVISLCLAAWTFADFVEARGGGGGRAGGGRGFSRGGGGNFGSIRNSARPSTRDFQRSSGARASHPSTSDRARKSRDDLNRPTQGGLSEKRSQRSQDRASNLTTEQKQQVSDRISDRAENLTPEQKDELRQKYEDSGLAAGQLPSEERDFDREDWQEWREENREDWQDWYEDQYDDHWHNHYHYGWWYGYPVSTVSYSFYIDDTPPCQEMVVINQKTGETSYYYCNSVWYQPAYAAGEVKYVVASPPAGGELTTLSKPYSIMVKDQEYFLSNHVFYQKVIRDGKTFYVTVDAPVGAMVPTIPQYAVEIEHQGKIYYRFDKIFYQRDGPVFEVVANPGV